MTPYMDKFTLSTMKCSVARFGRNRFTLLIVVLAGLGTAHILVRTATYGAVVTTDVYNFPFYGPEFSRRTRAGGISRAA